jgi:Zn-dependent protease
MRPSIRLGRILGIQIGLHYSWFIIASLIVFSLAGHFRSVNPQWSALMVWMLAGITGVLFFASIVAHELAHAVVANSRGMPVRSITLFALGGVANIEQESNDARSEFWMAIAGPAASFVLGLLFLGLVRATGWSAGFGEPTSPVAAGFLWLGYINIALAIFNMIPGFPMDGGRVLRAIAWRMTGDIVRATKIAAGIGQFIAAAFIVIGFFRFFAGAGLGGLWIAFIGWFLGEAAAASSSQIETTTALSQLRVRDLTSRDCASIEGGMNLRIFAEEYLGRTGQRCCIVRENGAVVGLITPYELKNVPRERWPFTTVAQTMRPINQIRAAAPDMTVDQALQWMIRENLNELPVIENGRLEGVISRARILEYLQTQAELKAA